MIQTVGHLDFFPNGGKEMPGCSKNILSQIVDVDGIWQGKTITCAKRVSGKACTVFFSICWYLGISQVSLCMKTGLQLYFWDRDFKGGMRRLWERKCTYNQISTDRGHLSKLHLYLCESLFFSQSYFSVSFDYGIDHYHLEQPVSSNCVSNHRYTS